MTPLPAPPPPPSSPLWRSSRGGGATWEVTCRRALPHPPALPQRRGKKLGLAPYLASSYSSKSASASCGPVATTRSLPRCRSRAAAAARTQAARHAHLVLTAAQSGELREPPGAWADGEMHLGRAVAWVEP
eukprot:scaffold2751_cov344-Prasinococcus_capsulatus_cf.AAC.5